MHAQRLGARATELALSPKPKHGHGLVQQGNVEAYLAWATAFNYATAAAANAITTTAAVVRGIRKFVGCIRSTKRAAMIVFRFCLHWNIIGTCWVRVSNSS
jgi:hypothetical protein